MKSLGIDLETFSSVDLSKCGVYRYASSPDFEILLFGFSVDGGDVQVVDLACGEEIPADIVEALSDDSVIKWSYNNNFERVCLSNYFGTWFEPGSWRCTMVWAAYLGLPRSLEDVGAVLGLEKQKLSEGKELIRYFCVPCKPTKTNGGRTRNLPEHDREKWERFKAYNLRDVEAEMQIQQRLAKFPVPEFVWEEYRQDQEINDRGIGVDMEMVAQAIAMDGRSKSELSAAMQELTELENPNSVQQMKQWLSENGVETDSLDKKAVAGLLKDAPEPLKTVLTLRQQLAKSSVKKYQAMENAVCADSRAHGMFAFYGANRTGRFSGRIIQLQNLYKNTMPDLAQARELVRCGDFEALEILYDSVPEVLSELIRTAFVPQDGRKFIVADFSAIEARVLAWLAGERWVSEVFEKGGDIYCETAARMFHCKVEKHGENAELRQKGKQATLSCGYGGSVGALKAMGALEAGMTEEELQPLVDSWREANPNIVQLWWAVDRAVKECIKKRMPTETHGIRFDYQSGMMFATLPSGRRLAYVKPRIGENRFGGESVTYMGVGGTKKWERLESYGAKFVENCVAEGTLVITNRGLIPIQEILPDDLIWDGEEWCPHEGLIPKGTQNVVDVNGLFMTPEHKILTEKGWMQCAESNGLKWAAVPLPKGFIPCRKYQAGKGSMGMRMHMRQHKNHICTASYSKKISCKIMRLYAFSVDFRSQYETRYVQPPSMGCVAFNETAMYGSEPHSLPQLRWAWNYCMRTLERQLREFLGGYGGLIPAGAGTGQDRQRPGIFSRKLSVDNKANQFAEQAQQPQDKYPLWENDGCRTVRKDRNRRNNNMLPTGSRMARRIAVYSSGFTKRVYDIRNCGKRHRFAVWDGEAGEARIVSNCTQAISRDILCYAMQTLKNCAIVGHVHDEIIIEADRRMSVEAVCEQMGRTPPWAKGLLLRADGYECDFYQKD